MRSPAFAALVLVLGAGALRAQTLEVPGDYSDLQAAIDAAPDDATILVHGGHWFALTLSRPVRIVAEPMAYIWGDGEGTLDAPITLAGPGAGDVVLSNLSVGMLVYAGAFVSNAPAVQGGGFDGLFVYDSIVSGPVWDFVYNYVFPGAPAIQVALPLVWVERSTITGSSTAASRVNQHSPATNPTPLGTPGGSGIVAPLSVVLIDSTVQGGSGDTVSYDAPGCGFPCPGGDGGNGVVCRTLVHARSTIRAGGPTFWYDETGVQFCCAGARGRRTVVLNELVLTTPPSLGSQALTAPRHARIGARVVHGLAQLGPDRASPGAR